MRAIRTTSHKLIWNMERNVELFDLLADPDELHNLADTQLQIRGKLHNILNDWMRQTRSHGDVTFFESKDAENLDALRSLGYVE